MPITNTQSGTNVNEIVDGIYRISTPVDAIPGGFTFNQYLIVDDDALLFHMGGRQLFPLVREAVASVIPMPGCAMWRSRISKPTNAAQSMNGSPRRPTRPRCAGVLRG